VNSDTIPGKRIRVVCPYCSKLGVVVVDKDVVGDDMLERSDSMVPMRVFCGDICEHDFTVTLDGQYKVRSSCAITCAFF